MTTEIDDRRVLTRKISRAPMDNIISVLFHYPSPSWQDKIIQWSMPKAMRREYLHVSVGIGRDWYTWTHRGLEVLDPDASDIYSVQWMVVEDTMPYLCRAFEICQQRVTLKSLLLAKLGFTSNTCASLVGRVVWEDGVYQKYPCEVMDAIENDGVWY